MASTDGVKQRLARPSGKMRRKADLPTKRCAGCGLLFAWRKKWARDWENVRFCSDRCRASTPASSPGIDKA